MMQNNNINLELLKKQQFSKYSSYNIPNSVLENEFDKIKNISDENEIILKYNKKINEYIVDQIKQDNIDIQINVIEKYNYLKIMIIKNKKYALSKDEINKIYEEAIELLKERYDNNELLNINIINNMKYIILKNNKQIEYEKPSYDITFLKKYMQLYEIDLKEYSLVMGCSEKELSKMLAGEIRTDENDIYLLCKLFDAEDYEDLKKIIEDKINFFIKKEEVLNKMKKEKNKNKTKINNNNQNKYNLSFLKEYANLYEISTNELSNKLHCGIKKVEDIINGNLLVNEDIINEIAYEFNAKNYYDLKNKIISKIKIRKENTNKNQNNQIIKEEEKTLEIESINENKIFDILNVKNMAYTDALITILLFSNHINKSVDDIAKFLNINKSYILKVYINNLDVLKEHLLKDNKNIKLLHKKEEVE